MIKGQGRKRCRPWVRYVLYMASVLLICQVTTAALAFGVPDITSLSDNIANQGSVTANVVESVRSMKHTVHFDANAADDGFMEDLVVESRDIDDIWSLALPACGYTRAGYRFTGWSTTADGANWKGDVSIEENEVIPTIDVPDKAVLRGWSCNSQENGLDADIDLSDAVKDETLTLYAQWVPEVGNAGTSRLINSTDNQLDELDNAVVDTDAETPADRGHGVFFAALGSDARPHVHVKITSSKNSYSAGSTVAVSVDYVVNNSLVHENDYMIVRMPRDIVKHARISCSPQHFKEVIDVGDGTYKLVFGPQTDTAHQGMFLILATTADVPTETSNDIQVNGDTLRITVIPSGSANGSSGAYNDAIMKDAADNGDKVQLGGYDYSEGEGNNAAQIGIYDSTKDQSLKYRLFVNQKMAWMHEVTVVDTLPDGMTFDTSHEIEVLYKDNHASVEKKNYSLSLDGNKLVFKHPSFFYRPIQINYWVIVKGGGNVKYTNRAEINYKDTDNKTYQEHRNYVLQGNGYNAVNGEKSVDKAIVSSDSNNQWVTYTFKFWNDRGFQKSEIKLDDRLQDKRVKFLYAEKNDKFDVRYDPQTHVVHIENMVPIGHNETEYVRFVVDFTDVPDGSIVYNSVNNGNPTKTLKAPSVKFQARKTVDGRIPDSSLDGKFKFQLLDAKGSVIQTKHNDGGDVIFDTIKYKEEDVGKTFTYTVQEIQSDDTDVVNAYQLDRSKFTIQVVITKTTDAQGKEFVAATPTIKKSGLPVDAMSFDNVSKTGKLSIMKTVEGATKAAQDKIFHFRLSLKTNDGGSLPGKYSYVTYDVHGIAVDGASGLVGDGGMVSMKDGQRVELAGLPINTFYKVQEVEVPDGFTLTSSKGETGTIALGHTSEAAFKNAYETNGSISLMAAKVLKGASLAEGQFSFELRDVDGRVLQTVRNDGNGAVVFSPISFAASDDGKSFTYRIVEVNDGQSGVIYDAHICLVEVAIADDGAGNLIATTTYKTDGQPDPNIPSNTFINMTTRALPHTGGDGLGWSMGLGILVSVVALVIYWRENIFSRLGTPKRRVDE